MAQLAVPEDVAVVFFGFAAPVEPSFFAAALRAAGDFAVLISLDAALFSAGDLAGAVSAVAVFPGAPVFFDAPAVLAGAAASASAASALASFFAPARLADGDFDSFMIFSAIVFDVLALAGALLGAAAFDVATGLVAGLVAALAAAFAGAAFAAAVLAGAVFAAAALTGAAFAGAAFAAAAAGAALALAAFGTVVPLLLPVVFFAAATAMAWARLVVVSSVI